MAFRVWIEPDIETPIGVALIRHDSPSGTAQIFSLKTSTYVRLADDGVPALDQMLLPHHYGPASGPLRGLYWCDFPDVAFVWGAAARVVQLDALGNPIASLGAYAIDPKIGRLNIGISRNI